MKTLSHALSFTLSMIILAVSAGCEPSQDGPVSQNPGQSGQELAETQTSFMREELNSISADSLSPAEAEAILFMREEEKLARDMYAALETKWALRPMTNIKSSEQTHMTALLFLIDRYALIDPVGSNVAGQFTDTSLQNLYNALLKSGSVSVNDALTVGAVIEEVDIVDLQHRTAVTDNKDVLYVYAELMRGSRNHLRAFTKNLHSRGVMYVPRYLPQQEYDLIISGGQETGRTSRPGGR